MAFLLAMMREPLASPGGSAARLAGGNEIPDRNSPGLRRQPRRYSRRPVISEVEVEPEKRQNKHNYNYQSN